MQNKLKAIGKIAMFLILIISFWIYGNMVLEFRKRVVLNVTEYRFIQNFMISPANEYCLKSPFIIIIVTSYVGNIELRNLFRKAMPQKFLESMNTTRIFLLAKIPPNVKNTTQKLIEEENEQFRDILQGSFIEDYSNLTIKHLMGLRWVATQCQNASYIVRVDDGSVNNLERLFKYLTTTAIIGDFLMGFIQNDTIPQGDTKDKEFLEEYPWKNHLRYVRGFFYITTPSVAAKLVNEAKYHPYYSMDDRLITGVLTEASGIQLIEMPQEFWFENTLNNAIHVNKENWDLLAYNYTLAIVSLAERI